MIIQTWGTDNVFIRYLDTQKAACKQSLTLDWEWEMEALHELRQAFEVATAQAYGLVDLVFTCQTGFLSESIHNKIQWS